MKMSLDRWLATVMSADVTEYDGALTRIALLHVQSGVAAKELHSVRFGASGKGYQPSDLQTTLKGIADNYGADLPGVQTYQLQAFFAGRADPQAYYNFTQSGNIDNNGLGSEAPDEKGMRQQAMRWNDNVLATTFQRQRVQDEAMAEMVRMQQTMLREAYAQNQSLRADSNDAFAVLREFFMKEAEGRHDLRMKELAYERGNAYRQEAMKLAPALVNTLTGREVFPAQMQDTAILEAFAEKVDADKLPQLIAALDLDAATVSLLMPRLTQLLENKQRAAQVKALAAKAPDAISEGQTTVEDSDK